MTNLNKVNQAAFTKQITEIHEGMNEGNIIRSDFTIVNKNWFGHQVSHAFKRILSVFTNCFGVDLFQNERSYALSDKLIAYCTANQEHLTEKLVQEIQTGILQPLQTKTNSKYSSIENNKNELNTLWATLKETLEENATQLITEKNQIESEIKDLKATKEQLSKQYLEKSNSSKELSLKLQGLVSSIKMKYTKQRKELEKEHQSSSVIKNFIILEQSKKNKEKNLKFELDNKIKEIDIDIDENRLEQSSRKIKIAKDKIEKIQADREQNVKDLDSNIEKSLDELEESGILDKSRAQKKQEFVERFKIPKLNKQEVLYNRVLKQNMEIIEKNENVISELKVQIEEKTSQIKELKQQFDNERTSIWSDNEYIQLKNDYTDKLSSFINAKQKICLNEEKEINSIIQDGKSYSELKNDLEILQKQVNEIHNDLEKIRYNISDKKAKFKYLLREITTIEKKTTP